MNMPSEEHDKVLRERARGGADVGERWIMLLIAAALLALVIAIASTFT